MGDHSYLDIDEIREEHTVLVVLCPEDVKSQVTVLCRVDQRHDVPIIDEGDVHPVVGDEKEVENRRNSERCD